MILDFHIAQLVHHLCTIFGLVSFFSALGEICALLRLCPLCYLGVLFQYEPLLAKYLLSLKGSVQRYLTSYEWALLVARFTNSHQNWKWKCFRKKESLQAHHIRVKMWIWMDITLSMKSHHISLNPKGLFRLVLCCRKFFDLCKIRVK